MSNLKEPFFDCLVGIMIENLKTLIRTHETIFPHTEDSETSKFMFKVRFELQS